MSLADDTASLEEVAAAMNRRPGWLKRHARRLHEANGFPRPIAGSAWAFPRRAVETWLRAGGAVPQLPSPANQNGPGDYVAAYAAALKQRFGATP
jgi:hypothetical protein